MPTLLFLQSSDAGTVAITWPWLLGLLLANIAGIIAAIVGWLKYRGERRKWDTDSALGILDRLPAFLTRLEEAHAKALTDRTTIEDLKIDLAKCINGQITCEQMKNRVRLFMERLEPMIMNITECNDLLVECRQFQVELKVPKFEILEGN